ncbi:hypothetical protein [Malikia granosa]|nr:hypothetical protein [Malikia granosa]
MSTLAEKGGGSFQGPKLLLCAANDHFVEALREILHHGQDRTL